MSKTEKPVSQTSIKRDTRPQVTYKGIEKETQVAVRKAADKAGKNIGAWVNEQLLKAAHEELKEKTINPPMDIHKELVSQREILVGYQEALNKLTQKIDGLNKPKASIMDKLFGSTPK